MKKILIVDDEPLFLMGLTKALTTVSVAVVAAETGRAALDEIAVSPVDVCFLDLFLPDMSGMAVLEEIRAVSPETRVVMMTAGVVDAATREVIERTAHQFLPKPVDLSDVRMLARRLLERTGSAA